MHRVPRADSRPGHNLQMFMAARYDAHRRLFTTPFYGEGWALY
jgi:uncharacterized protein (DUF885 family)